MLPVPLRLPGGFAFAAAVAAVARRGSGSVDVDVDVDVDGVVDAAGLWRRKVEGSGEGRRGRIREAKDSLEARVVREGVVGGMLLGSWESLGGVPAGGGVGGRGRKKGILRGDVVGEGWVGEGTEVLRVAFEVVDSLVGLSGWGASSEGALGLGFVGAWVVLLLLGSLAEALFVAVPAFDAADTDAWQLSVLLLSCGDSGLSAVVVPFCCDLAGEESMLVRDEDSLE